MRVPSALVRVVVVGVAAFVVVAGAAPAVAQDGQTGRDAARAGAVVELPPEPPAPDGRRVLVLDLKAVGVEPALAQRATSAVVDALARAGVGRVLGAGELKAIASLEADKQLLGCEADAACVAELSAAAQAELVVAGSVGKVGADVVLSLGLLRAGGAGPAVVERRSGSIDPQGDVEARAGEIALGLFGGAKAGAAPKFALPEGEERSFAVLDLDAAGVSADVAKNLTAVLSTELKRIEGATVVGRDDVQALLALEGEKSLLGACDSAECLAEIGGALGVARIVVGSVGNVAGTYVVSLRLISTKRIVVENRVTESFVGREEQLLGAVRAAGRALLGIASSGVGALQVSCSEEGAEVFVDGVARGLTPTPPFAAVPVGRRAVVVRKDRFVEWRGDVYVDEGATAAQWVQLERRPDEWYESWVFWTSVAGIGAVAAATTVGVVGLLVYEDVRPHEFSFAVGLPERTPTSGASP